MSRLQYSGGARLIRVVAALLGGSLVILALFGDRLGVGGQGGFGGTQAVALLLGIGLLALAWGWDRFPALYRGTALILLNTIVLLALLEFGAALLLVALEPWRLPDPVLSGAPRRGSEALLLCDPELEQGVLAGARTGTSEPV